MSCASLGCTKIQRYPALRWFLFACTPLSPVLPLGLGDYRIDLVIVLPCKVAAPWGLTMTSHSCPHCYSLALELCPSYSHDSPLSLGHMGPSPLWALIYPTKWKSCWGTSSFYSTPYKISQRKEPPDSRLFFEMEIIDKTNHILEKRNYSASSKRTWQ